MNAGMQQVWFVKLPKTSNADLTAHGQLKLGSPSTAA